MFCPLSCRTDIRVTLSFLIVDSDVAPLLSVAERRGESINLGRVVLEKIRGRAATLTKEVSRARDTQHARL